MMKVIALGAFGATILLACAGHAQDGSETVSNRTPANAQKFLTATAPEAFAGVPGDNDPFVREGDVTSPDACTTVISGPPGRALLSNYVPYSYTKGRVRSAQEGGIWVRMNGRKVSDAIKGYEGYRAGIRTGDEIVEVNGQAIDTVLDFRIALTKQLEAGGPARITLVRNGTTLTVSATPARGDSTIEIPLNAPAPGTLRIDWSKVQQVTASQHTSVFFVNLSTPSDAKSPSKWLSYSIAGTRDRVLAAAQYLQQACDKTKELGF